MNIWILGALALALMGFVVFMLIKKPWAIAGGLLRNLLVGGSVLLLTDYLGKSVNLHIPVNLGTLGVTAVLGWPGVVALAAIQKWIL